MATDPTPAVEETVELTDIDAARAVWDANQPAEEPAIKVEAPIIDNNAVEGQPRGADGKFAPKDAPQPTEPQGAPAEAEVTPEEEPTKASEPPGHLPEAVKAVWADMPEAAREAVAKSQGDMARKMGESEQVRRAIEPIYQQIVRAAQEMPQLANMQPEQIAAEVFELSKWAARLQDDPVAALAEVAEARGATEGLKARLAGEVPDASAGLQREVAQLRQQIAAMSNPEALQSRITQTMEQARIQADVQAFSQTHPDWGVLEPHIAARIPETRDANPHLSPAEVLEVTYNTVATELLGPLKGAAAAEADRTRKAGAAKAATSINVQQAGAGAPPVQSDRAMAKAIWDRNHGG